MPSQFELFFTQREGWLTFYLYESGQTRASGRTELSSLMPFLEAALEKTADEAVGISEDQYIRPWQELAENAFGRNVFNVMLADAPADLTIQLDGSVEESIYDLFRMAPWSEVIESFAFEDEQSNHLLIADRSVTLIDIRIASTEALYVDSIGGVEDVPPQLDFHSDQDDREATGTLFPVWFGTNRKLVEIDGETYVSPREIEAETLHTGCCTVHIPKTHRRGETVSPWYRPCLLYTSPSPRDRTRSRMPSSA